MKTFVIGDIHGEYNALRQCFERSDFDYEVDHLICLGDVCDRGPEVRECFDELLRIKHLTYILGNHDVWGLEWMLTGSKPQIWTAQGGNTTINSYTGGSIPESHIKLLQEARLYYIENNRLFVHGGFDPGKPLEEHTAEELVWNRSLVQQAMEYIDSENIGKLTDFEEIYVGHTPTINYGFDVPIHIFELWMMDTGAGWWGRLSMLDIESKKLYQSDSVTSLYPDIG